jgi:tetratricopeptide (TPR) repeat protein
MENVISEEDIVKDLEELKIRKISSTRNSYDEIGARLSEFHVEEKLQRHNSNKVLVKKVSVWMAGSAMAVLIAVSSLLLIGSAHPDYQKLYSEYYAPRDADVQRTITGSPDDPYSQAMKYYIAQDYSSADHHFHHLVESEASNEAILYKGINNMELGNYLAAIEIFNRLEDKDLTLRHEAMWYKSLCYLALGNEKATFYALQEIINSNGFYKTMASSLLRKL